MWSPLHPHAIAIPNLGNTCISLVIVIFKIWNCNSIWIGGTFPMNLVVHNLVGSLDLGKTLFKHLDFVLHSLGI
jgi:hypothetical protein